MQSGEVKYDKTSSRSTWKTKHSRPQRLSF